MDTINRFIPSVFSSDSSSSKSTRLPARDEISDEFKWQLNDLYPDLQAFESERKELQIEINAIAACRGTLEDSTSLSQCLKLRDELNMKIGRLFAYARMHLDSDARNTNYQAITSQIETLIAQVSGTTSFIEPELLTISSQKLLDMIAEEKNLQPYRFYIKDLLRQNHHVLSPIEEELLAKAGEILKAPTNIFTTMTNADLKFPETITDSGDRIELSEGRYHSLIRSTNREVRKSAFQNLFGSYADYRNTFATTLSSHIKNTVFYAKTKKYTSSLEAALEHNNVPVDVYTNLINTIHKNLEPLHQYITVKKKALQLDSIHMYDLYVPIAKEAKAEIPYQDGIKLVLDSLKPLGASYCRDLLLGVDNGWIDVYENQGKRTGAYSWGVYGVHPFVLLNYDGRYGAVSTLAHELGHAMHSFYSNKIQDYINASYTIFCAEVASTTNEILLLDHMLEIEKDPQKRMFYINQYLEQVRTTVYRQVMFAEFEMITHQKVENGESLTADLLETLWLDLNKKYYGDDIIIDDKVKIEWARIPHFYRSFYVYQYATGYAAATTLANNLQNDSENARCQYLSYLQSGGSAYSLDLLKKAGVDMRTAAPLQITLEKFSIRLKELEKFLANT